MKVYLVKNCYGSYDGSGTSIDKIFISKKKPNSILKK